MVPLQHILIQSKRNADSLTRAHRGGRCCAGALGQKVVDSLDVAVKRSEVQKCPAGLRPKHKSGHLMSVDVEGSDEADRQRTEGKRNDEQKIKRGEVAGHTKVAAPPPHAPIPRLTWLFGTARVALWLGWCGALALQVWHFGLAGLALWLGMCGALAWQVWR